VSPSATQSRSSAAATRDLGYPAPASLPYIRIVRQDELADARRPSRGIDDLSCRAVNVLVALVGIVLTAPLMVLVAVAVKLSSPGPVFYTQQRVGLDRRAGRDRRGQGMGSRKAQPGRRNGDHGGALFTIYKFRTMRPANGPAQQVWASKNDPRITAVGHVLRKYRLDELPQLFNVLKGEMNIVGPRPEQPDIFGRLRTDVDLYVERQKVLPGITGWAQVNHQYDQSLEDVKAKVALDLEYIRSRSAIKDLWIMALTLPVMMGRRGAI
jgi:lipopolysaccharide/colanic/teichoic acid biosynthesis glycosyltransferase